MATYLATVTLGRFQVHRASAGGIPVYVARRPAGGRGGQAGDRPDPGDHRVRAVGLRAVPVRDRRRDRRPRPERRLRAGDARPSPIFDSAPRTSRTLVARARPPVVRRLRVARPSGRTSGSTRASRRTRSGCGREHTGGETPQQIFDRLYATPAADATLGAADRRPGGPANIFGTPSYDRGAMTLQVLRNADRRRRVLHRAADLGHPAPVRPRHHRRSSSRWPSGSRTGTWPACSRPGCSRRASPASRADGSRRASPVSRADGSL